jgi:hypothetical protein
MNTPAPHVHIFQAGEEVWYIMGNGLAKIGKVVSDAVMPNVRIPSFIFLFSLNTSNSLQTTGSSYCHCLSWHTGGSIPGRSLLLHILSRLTPVAP